MPYDEGRVYPGNGPRAAFGHHFVERKGTLWSPPEWAKSATASVPTTTAVVFPGSGRNPGQPESRTPDSLCLSQGRFNRTLTEYRRY